MFLFTIVGQFCHNDKDVQINKQTVGKGLDHPCFKNAMIQILNWFL